MKTRFLVPAFICGLILPAVGQVTADAQKPESRTAAEAERAKQGKLATRDQHGTFKTQDVIVRSQGTTQFIKSGKMSKISAETKLSEGFTVMPDGKITKPDGSTVTLEEGQMMTLDGQIVQAPRSTGTTAPGAGAKELPPTSGNLTDYGQDGPDLPEGGPAKK